MRFCIVVASFIFFFRWKLSNYSYLLFETEKTVTLCTYVGKRDIGKNKGNDEQETGYSNMLLGLLIISNWQGRQTFHSLKQLYHCLVHKAIPFSAPSSKGMLCWPAGNCSKGIAQVWEQDTAVYSSTAHWLELGERQDSCLCIMAHFISKAQIVHTKPAQLYP